MQQPPIRRPGPDLDTKFPTCIFGNSLWIAWVLMRHPLRFLKTQDSSLLVLDGMPTSAAAAGGMRQILEDLTWRYLYWMASNWKPSAEIFMSNSQLQAWQHRNEHHKEDSISCTGCHHSSLIFPMRGVRSQPLIFRMGCCLDANIFWLDLP